MMQQFDWLERTELLTGQEGIEKLAKANVLVVGLGGVGSFAAEFVARAGVGKMTIVDGDVVDKTNINRQLQALSSTIGVSKADLMEQRLLDINPEIELTVIKEFLSPERANEIVTSANFDFALDCIDSIQPKVMFIETCYNHNIKFASSGGAGGKLDPATLKISDISETYNCKMLKAIRKRLHKRNIKKGFRVVYSTELQDSESLRLTDGSNFKKSFYGTISYMPALFGCGMASLAIRYILENK